MLAYVLIVIVVALAVSALAERRNVQPALLVVMVGLGASYIPGIPRLELHPEIILGVVLPPMLFSAARNFSFAEFRRRMGSIVNLGVFLVFGTTVATGAAVLGALPELLPITALIIGVVVAPPDAVTAITIGGRAGLPRRLMTVLKGESLINDAAALTLFTVLVATAAGTHAFIDNVPLYFLYTASIGIIVGLVIGNLAQIARRVLASAALSTALSVIIPFAAYLVAEELHASGVLAVVAAGFAMGHHGVQAGYEERLQESAFWRTLDTLLETFVFAYIGLQLRFVITDAYQASFDLWDLALATAAIVIASVVVRFAWIFATALIGRWRYRLTGEDRRQARHASGSRVREKPAKPLSWRENTVLAWTGMRGVVTLAAAAGTPLVVADGSAFPGREAILALAFLVTIATLLIQGLSLPWLIAKLKLEDPDHESFMHAQRQRADIMVRQATQETLNAYAADHPDAAAQRMVSVMRQRLSHENKIESARTLDAEAALALGKLLLETRRSRLVDARDQMELDDMVVREMLEDLDIEQAFMDSVTTGRR